jgi:hypothetical protein
MKISSLNQKIIPFFLYFMINIIWCDDEQPKTISKIREAEYVSILFYNMC